jgi:hypothetical protein
MRKLYIEGLATHGGPKLCVGVREGAGEALAGVRAGRVIEPRNQRIGVPTPSRKRKATLLAALYASCQRAPRGHRTRACTPIFMRENREIPRSPIQVDHWVGRLGNTEVVSLR